MRGRVTAVAAVLSVACLGLGGCSGEEPARSSATGAGAVASAPKPPAAPVGEDTYRKFCFSCHQSGAAGAPKLGDTASWAPRIAKGSETMLKNVIDGMPPGMPARGICVTCSDEELRDAITYMVSKSQ